MGCGHRPHHAPGHYARLNKGIEARLTTVEESNDEDNTLPEEAMFAAVSNMSVPLLSDFALGSSMGTEPKTLDEVPMTMRSISSQNLALGI